MLVDDFEPVALNGKSDFLTLGHRDVTPSLEHHHRNRSTRECITDDEFSNNIKTNLLISDSLNHSDRNDVEVCWKKSGESRAIGS